MKPQRLGDGAGPSHEADEIIGEEQMEALQEAVQQIPPQMDDPSFRDPLGDYCDGSSFNIIQFLSETENDSPSVSPAGAGGQRAPNQPQHPQLQHPQLQHQQHLQQAQIHQPPQQHNMAGMNNMHPQQQQQHHQQHMQQQQHNNNRNHVQVAVDNHMAASGRQALPGSSRLPDSPPITDVSAGSSGSPSSSNSGNSPYSPDNYGNYSVLSGHNGNNGLILGVNDLAQAGQDAGMLDALQMMPQTGIPANGRHPQMQGGHYMHSPFGSAQTQISPAALAMRQQTQYQQPMDNGAYGSMDMYGDLMDEGMEAANMGRMPAGPSRKRARNSHQNMEMQQQPVFDRSRVKPDPMQHSYPPQPSSRFAPTPGIVMASSPVGGESYMDEEFRNEPLPSVIKFNRYNEDTWQTLLDEHHNELRQIQVHVVADKGFNYMPNDKCFVNQKKNHFQVSVNIEANDEFPCAFVVVNREIKRVVQMSLSFCGVKAEMPTSEIPIRQSQGDRKPGPHDPVVLSMIPPRQLTKVTVPRLHFSETTMNNQRKNNKPNPDQKYFLLVVKLLVTSEDGGVHLVQAHASERVIVRTFQATNPGQFEPPEADVQWQKNGSILYSNNPVSIGTHETMGGALNVAGDIILTGQLQQPSDRRLKENIVNLDKKEAMDRVNKLRIVQYDYKEDIAAKLGMEKNRNRYGIIAQELNEIHPESVNKDGEFMVVDENRIFYDNVAAVQGLSEMHKDLEGKIDGRVEDMQKALGKIFRRKPNDGISVISEDSGLAHNNKALATSRLSLASAFKREISKQNKQESCRNPGCSRSDHSSHCSSKLTQGTIVTLVVVMAVCLLSMSALYVLDWHARNYGFNSIPSPTDKPGDKDDSGLGYMTNKFHHVPHHQPGAPPLHDICLHGACRTVCCDKKATYDMETRHGGFDVDTVVPLAGSKKAFLAAIAGVVQMTPTAFFPQKLSSGIRFEIEGIEGRNMTIDSRYCTERSCNEKRGIYHLFVPVSPYMPTTPVMLRITPPEGMFVQSCGHVIEYSGDECPGHFTLNMPTAMEVERNLFEVSAGSYKRSGYRFRVGTNTESCFGPEERFRSSFEEYNLVFYRACGDELEQAPTTIDIENDKDHGVGKMAGRPAVNATAA